MNPILLKELRQSVRNRVVLGAYLLYILALLVLAGVVAVNGYANPAVTLGHRLFGWVAGLAAFILFVFVPLQTLLRLMRERWRADPDLQYIAPLAPSAFALGKLASGFALAGLFAAASAPFLFIAYFLGGVDIPNLLFCVAAAAAILLGALLAAILIGIAPMPKFIRWLAGLGFAGLLMLITHSLVKEVLLDDGLDPGFAAGLFERESVCEFLTVCLAALSLAAILHTGVIAGFRDPGTNRMRPLRVASAAVGLGWLAWLTFLKFTTNTFDEHIKMAKVLMLCGMIIACGASLLCVFAASERDTFSMRRLQNAPRGIFKRVLAWLLDNGQMGGMSMNLLLVFAGLLLVGYHNLACASSNEMFYGIFPMTVCAYALTFTLAWRFIFRRWFRNTLLWLYTAASVAVLGVVFTALSEAGILPENFPGNAFIDDNAHWAAVALYIWNGLALLAFVPLAVRDFFKFHKECL